jgi:hypothetical protein
MVKRSVHRRRRSSKGKRRGGGGPAPLSPGIVHRGGGLPALSPGVYGSPQAGGQGGNSAAAMTDGKAGGQTHTKSDMAAMDASAEQTGGKRRRGCKSKKRRHGGGLLATAAVPFGLFGLQKYFSSRSTRKGVKRFSRSVGRKLGRTFRKM